MTTHPCFPPQPSTIKFELLSQPLTTEPRLNQTDFSKLKKCYFNFGLEHYKLSTHFCLVFKKKSKSTVDKNLHTEN